MVHILVVDDESSIRITLREFLTDEGYQVEIAENADKARSILAKKEIDIVLADIIMPRVTGVRLLKEIKDESPQIQVIMMTGEPTVETASEAVRTGAFDYLTKPINKIHLLKIVANAVKVKNLDDLNRTLAEDNRRYQENLEQIVEERTMELKKEIEARKKTKTALVEREKRYYALFENSPVPLKEEDFSNVKKKIDSLKQKDIKDFREYFDKNPLFVKECAGLVKILEVNKAVLDLHDAKSKDLLLDGLPSVLTEKSLASFKEELIAIAEGRNECEFETSVKTMAGKEKYINFKWVVVPGYEKTLEKVYISTVDITKRKKAEDENAALEKQLRRGQKLETIGTLAGGIAHDFNNILTPILGYTDMAIAELPEKDPLKQNLSRVLEGAHRAKDLIEQILLFSKQIEKERNPLNIHIILKEALQLLRSSIPTTVNIVQRIDNSCKKVLADATQIHQVIVNLCTNAWHAMEDQGGTLTVELKQVEVDAANAELHPNLHEAEYVRLTIQDNGHGMDETVLDRVFEPFFTTKAVDKGTGLGLSVVHGIVHSHKGEILVYSEPGQGTVFHVYLPVIITEGLKEKTKREPILSGNESIMIVDDDRVIGNMLSQMLERLGYKVDLYNKSKDVIEAFKKNSEKYDLIISDLTMPEFSGIEVAQVVQIVNPDFPIIIMTGYGDKLAGINQESHGIKKVLQKPILMNDLATAIRDVLDKR